MAGRLSGRATIVTGAASGMGAASAKLFATKLNQKDAAKVLLKEMLEKDRIKDTREAQEAKSFLLGL